MAYEGKQGLGGPGGPGGPGGDDKNNLAKLFVGGIHLATTEDTLRDHFSVYGAIVDSVIIKDQNKKPRGFGFITYNDPNEADNALANRPHTIDGKTVEIKRAIPREDNRPASHVRTKKIFIGGLPSAVTDDDVRTYIDNTYIGFGKVVNVDLIRDKESGAVKGFGFVELDNEDLVDRMIIHNKYPIICGKKVEIKKAEPKEARGAGGPAGGFRGGRGGGGGGGRGGFRGGSNSGGGGNFYGGPGGYGGGNFGNQGGGYGAGGFDGGYGNNQGGGYGFNAYGGANNGGYNNGAGGYGAGGFGGGGAYGAGNTNSSYGDYLGSYGQGGNSYGANNAGYNQNQYGAGYGGGPMGGGNAAGGDVGGGRGGQARYRPY